MRRAVAAAACCLFGPSGSCCCWRCLLWRCTWKWCVCYAIISVAMRSLTRSSWRHALSLARSLSLSLSFFVGGATAPPTKQQTQPCGTCARVSQQYAHTDRSVCTCMRWVAVRSLESKQAREPQSDPTPTHSLATQTFPVDLITTRALFSTSSNLSYSRILLSEVCTYFFVIVYLRASISWFNTIKTNCW